jgi:malate dehydrogenase (oxaloacetate-decarboxylating)(NADP+)
MDEFMKEFMEAMHEIFPQTLVQFEDFSTDNAFKYLNMFRKDYLSFNDDVRPFICITRESTSDGFQ